LPPVSVAGLVRRLPPPKMPAMLRSFLGNLQPQDLPERISKPLGPAETVRPDWTRSRIMAWPIDDRVILQGMMTGKSVRFITRLLEQLAALGEIERTLKKSSISPRDHKITATMACEWNQAGETIDEATREVWLSAAQKKK
jgi:hypothetical protein